MGSIKNTDTEEAQQPVSIADYESEMRKSNPDYNPVALQFNDSQEEEEGKLNHSPTDAEQYNNIANGRTNYEQSKGMAGNEGTPTAEEEASIQQSLDENQAREKDRRLRLEYEDKLNDYIESLADLAEKPLSQKEREKKERAIKAAGGIAALGNVANAFSNLIYTGKGAPAQTLPDAPNIAEHLKKLREEERAKVKNYLNNSAQKLAVLRAERAYNDTRNDYADAQNYKNAVLAMQQQKNQGELAKIAAQIKLYEMQGNKAAADALRSQYEALIKGNEAKYADSYYGSKARNEAARGGLISAQTKAAKASAANSWASAEKNADSRYKTILKTDGTTVKIPVSAWNPSNLGKILSAVHEPLVEKTTTTDAITGMPKTLYRKRDVNSMARRIGYVLSNGTDDQVAMVEQMLGSLSGEKPKGSISENRESEDKASEDSNTMPSLASKK